MAENVEIKLLLVVSEGAKFDSQVKFLRRRGWLVNVATTLREAIEYIASNHPDFVLISVNHPNPKVVKMPAIISQTFNCRSILIGESLDTQTAAALAKSGWKDVIHAPVSGPGIQLRVKQIMAREKQESDRMEREMAERAKLDNLKRAGEGVSQSSSSEGQTVPADKPSSAPSIAEQIAQRAESASQKAQSGVAYMPTNQEPSTSSSGQSSSKVQNFGGQPNAPGAAVPASPSINIPSGGGGPGASVGTKEPTIDQIMVQPPQVEAAPISAPGVETDTHNRFANVPEVEVPTPSAMANEFEFTAAGTNVMDAPPLIQEGAEGSSPSIMQEGTPSSSMMQQQGSGAEARGAAVQPGTGATGPGAMVQQSSGEGAQGSMMQEGSGSGEFSFNAQDGSSGSEEPGHYNPQINQSTFVKPERGESSAASMEQKEASEPQPINHDQPEEPESAPSVEHQPVEAKKIDIDIKPKMPRPAQLTSGVYEGTDMATILRIMREGYEECVDRTDSLHFGMEELYFDTYYINIESISGFLVYCSKSKYQIDSHLVPKINTRIIEGLKQGGFNMSKMQNMEATHLGKVEMTIDLLYEASLMSLVSGTSADDSLVLSFLDTSRSKQAMIYDKEKQMIGFPVEFIPSDTKSPFQVFLYLPVNKKYYLYLNEGNSFSEKQLEKLDGKGVKHLFVKQAEEEKLDDFFLSKRLTDKFKKSS